METSNENREKKFIKDFGIYSIGVIGNRLISFLILPFYTYYIADPSEYGYYDLCLNVCLTLLPITTLQMRESAFRFLLNNDNQQSKNEIVTFIIRSLLLSLTIVILASIFVFSYYNIRLFALIVLMLLSMTVFDTWLQMIRGLAGNKHYVNFSIILSFMIFILSILLIAILKMGIEGIFLSMVLSRVFVFLYGEYKVCMLRRYFHFRINTDLISKQVLKYALPLIPSSFITSLILTSNRFFIENFVSLHANGIYAVAFRFNMVMVAFALVFYQTWQETAFLQFNSKDRDYFFSKIFNYLLIILSVILILYTFLIKMNAWLVAQEYREAFQYLFLIGIAQFLYVLSASFFELGYQCSKETYREIYSSLLALVINVIFCSLLTSTYGVEGVIYSNIIAYLVLVVYRYFDTKRYFKISIIQRNFLIFPIIIIGAYLFYLDLGIVAQILTLLGLLLALVIITPKELKNQVCNKIKAKL